MSGDTLTFEQGPVASLRDSDQIVIRQSNGRDMLLPVSVLVDYVAHAITQATTSMRVPADRVDGLAVVAISGHYKDLHGKPDNPGGGGPQG